MGVARMFFSGGGGHFENFPTRIIKKIAKMHYFNIWIFEKIFANFQKIKKIDKNELFLHIFQRIYQTMLNLCAVGRKTQFDGNLWENFLKKIAENAWVYHIFQKI